LSLRTLFIPTLVSVLLTLRSWTYIPTDAPKYHNGHTINFVGEILVVVLAIFGIFYCMYENKARAAGKRDHRLEGLDPYEQEELGSRHPAFRYMI